MHRRSSAPRRVLRPTATFDERLLWVSAAIGQVGAAEPEPPMAAAIPAPEKVSEKATSHKSRGRKFSVGSQ